MKRIFYLGIIAMLASCSSSKYAANFQKTSSDFGYGELVKSTLTAPATVAEPTTLVASTSKDAAVITTSASTEQAAAVEQIRKHYSSLNTSEKKEFRKELKNQIKKMMKLNKRGIESTRSVEKTKMIDHDLKLAAIFGTIGVVALIISGNVFYIIGGIALIIGAVFFVMWLTRQ